jgi:GNAT superfamily N-acetyltransferase
LEKPVRQLDLEPSPNTWAVSCFLIAPHARGRGIARALLAAAVETARSEGATHLEGYPRREGSDPDELWTGPEALFLDAGFAVVRDSLPRAVVALELG